MSAVLSALGCQFSSRSTWGRGELTNRSSAYQLSARPAATFAFLLAFRATRVGLFVGAYSLASHPTAKPGIRSRGCAGCERAVKVLLDHVKFNPHGSLAMRSGISIDSVGGSHDGASEPVSLMKSSWTRERDKCFDSRCVLIPSSEAPFCEKVNRLRAGFLVSLWWSDRDIDASQPSGCQRSRLYRLSEGAWSTLAGSKTCWTE